MPFHLNTTRILYQSSKYAPVAVVQLELEVPPEESIELSPAAGLDQISSGSSGDLLALSRTGSPLEVYCALVLGLQRYGGHSVTYSRAEKNDADQEYRVFIEYEDHATALYAAELAVDLLNGQVRCLCTGTPYRPQYPAVDASCPASGYPRFEPGPAMGYANLARCCKPQWRSPVRLGHQPAAL